MRWLIFGASGFLGRFLLQTLGAAGHEALGTCHRHPGPDLVRFDIGHDSIQNVVDPNWFADTTVAVHCAGYGSIDDFAREKNRLRELAVDATTRLMSELAQRNVRQVFLSTNHVFDGEHGPYREQDACRPINEYGRQKRAVEEFLGRAIPNSLILRLDKVIGIQLAGDTVLAPWWWAIQAKQTLVCMDHTFTPIQIDDVVRSIVELAQAGKQGIFHIAGPTPVTRTELAREFCRVCGSEAEIIERSAAEMNLLDGRPQGATLDISKLRRELNFVPKSPREIVEHFCRANSIRAGEKGNH